MVWAHLGAECLFTRLAVAGEPMLIVPQLLAVGIAFAIAHFKAIAALALRRVTTRRLTPLPEQGSVSACPHPVVSCASARTGNDRNTLA